MNENIRQDLIKTILTLDDENVLAVREYIEFISDVQEEEPTSQDLQAIFKGLQEFANGEYVTWEKPHPDGL
ncbi:MAG: hypothetical protein WC647_09610 [Desulfomonilaceae bacterium]|jgi:hypothetical protein